MLKSSIKWYHLVTCHPGRVRLRLSIQQRFYHIDLCKEVDKFTCTTCTKHKLDGAGYGLLPEKDTRCVPFEEVAIDLTGPWVVQIRRGRPHKFHALTVIDTVTNLVEIVRLDNNLTNRVCQYIPSQTGVSMIM